MNVHSHSFSLHCSYLEFAEEGKTDEDIIKESKKAKKRRLLEKKKKTVSEDEESGTESFASFSTNLFSCHFPIPLNRSVNYSHE